MSQQYRRILSIVLPTGALGLSLLLGSTGTSGARDYPISEDTFVPPRTPVVERLAIIRDVVSEITGAEGRSEGLADGEKLAWHNWVNFSLGLPLWNNFFVPPWNNWNNYWNNGWNNWGNNWHNWNNGWNNWGNGWSNY